MQDVTLEDLPVLLAFVPAENRDVWVRVGMGIKAEFGDAGFADWDAWSQSGTGYKAADCKVVWASFRRAGVGIGSVVQMARAGGWEPEKKALSADDRKRLDAAAKARRAVRAAEVESDAARLAGMQSAVSAACSRVWGEFCTDAAQMADENAYLQAKRVPALGVRFARGLVLMVSDDQAGTCEVWAGGDAQRWLDALPRPRPAHLSFRVFRRGDLLIPLADGAGRLWSVQSISASGSKLFPKYGRKAGCYHLISGSDVLAVAEGYATAATVHMATGWSVAVAFDAGNLQAAAAAAMSAGRYSPLLVCGDDDSSTVGNPGRAFAQRAAEGLGGVAVLPDFSGCAA